MMIRENKEEIKRNSKVTFNKKWIHDIVMNELEIWMTDPVFDVVLATREKVIQTNHLMAFDH